MWYAIYTKAGKEDSVTFLLRNAGIDVLNAKLKSSRFRQNRLLELIEPLFPCYIFADFEKEKYAHMITYTRGIRYIVGKQNPIIVSNEIITAIKDNLEQDDIIIMTPSRFCRGDRVLIKDGPFKNFIGLFEREIRGPERVMILLDAIHYRLEIDGQLLEVA
jgi:transcriptional antiterminator RfaH